MLAEHNSAQLSFFRNSHFWNFLTFFLGDVFFENYLKFRIRVCGTILSAFNTAQNKFSFSEKTKWRCWDFFKNYVFFENDSKCRILVYGTFVYAFRATQHNFCLFKNMKVRCWLKNRFLEFMAKICIFSKNILRHNRALMQHNSAQLLFFWKLKMAVPTSRTFIWIMKNAVKNKKIGFSCQTGVKKCFKKIAY